jgi:hypothetical protein
MEHWQHVVRRPLVRRECTVTFPAITEQELFWAIAERVVGSKIPLIATGPIKGNGE